MFLLDMTMSFLLNTEEEKSLSVKLSCGRIVRQHDKQTQRSVNLEDIYDNKVY